ncbi:MAG: hypothetical protein ACE14T_07040 [Syntrophales bacterium]
MKRCFFLLAVALFLGGCASVRESEFFQHDTMYRSWSHLSFSCIRYHQPDMELANTSRQEQWWGIPVYYERGREKKVTR